MSFSDKKNSTKNNYNKINFIYRTPPSLYSFYMCYKGLETALERNGLLHYAYDTAGAESLNMEELLKYPILCFRGSLEPVFDVVKLIAGRQFVADINSESLFPSNYTYSSFFEKLHFWLFRKKKRISKLKNLPFGSYPTVLKKVFNKGEEKIQSISDYFQLLKDREEYFNLYFSPVEEDLSRYFNKTCYWFASWVHTELLDDIAEPVSDKIGFIGSVTLNRFRFFSHDKNKIIELASTTPKKDSIENIKELGRLINKYKYLVCPMGMNVRTMPGKAFEYMACKRLCFCYLDEEYMFKSRLLFEDGKDIVYFKTFAELEEKYRYYLKNSEEADQIAQAGYEKVRKYHNADISAKRFAERVLHHANGGEYNESFNDVSIFGGKPH